MEKGLEVSKVISESELRKSTTILPETISKEEHNLKLAPIKREIQKTALRAFEDKPFNVSKEAVEVAREETETYLKDIALAARSSARDSKRVTLKEVDFLRAKELLKPDWESEVIKRGHCPKCFGELKEFNADNDPSVRFFRCQNCDKEFMTFLKL